MSCSGESETTGFKSVGDVRWLYSKAKEVNLTILVGRYIDISTFPNSHSVHACLLSGVFNLFPNSNSSLTRE